MPAANVFAKPARFELRGGRRAAAGRPDDVARALHARPPALGRDRARAGRRRGHVDVRRAVRARGRRPRLRHLQLGREDRARGRARRRGRLRLPRRAGSRSSPSAPAAASTSCWTRRARGRRAQRACARAAASCSSAHEGPDHRGRHPRLLLQAGRPDGHDDGQPDRLPRAAARLRDADLAAASSTPRGRSPRPATHSRRMAASEQFGKLVLTT